MLILFLHGWQSISGGVKPSYLTQHGHTVINPKLPDDDFEQAIRIACGQKTRPRWKFFGSLICNGVEQWKTRPIVVGFGGRTA